VNRPLILFIGGVAVKFNLLNGKPSLIRKLYSKYRPFFKSTSKQFSIDVYFLETQYSGSIVPSIYSNKFKTYVKREDFFAIIDSIRMNCTLLIRPNEFSFESFLRVLFTVLLTKRNGLLLHSAGIVKNKRLYLFSGPESHGKTTTAKLLKKYIILSDDITLVRKSKGSNYLGYTTPFWGNMKCGIKSKRDLAKVRLKTIFFLSRNKTVALKKISKGSAFSKLLRNTLFFSSEHISFNAILKTVSNIAGTVPCFECNVKNGGLEKFHEITKGKKQ